MENKSYISVKKYCGKWVLEKIISVLAVIGAITLISGVSILIYKANVSDKEDKSELFSNSDIEIAGSSMMAPFNSNSKETKVVTITTEDVWTEMDDIAELMTESYNYSGNGTIESTAGWNICDDWTKHTIMYTYSGTIKAGYELSDIKIDIDNENKIITVSLGNQIIENNLPQETVQVIEQNNFWNPIESSELTVALAEKKAEELDKAEAEGIFEEAKENVKYIIEDRLAVFDEYTVQFEDNSKKNK